MEWVSEGEEKQEGLATPLSQPGFASAECEVESEDRGRTAPGWPDVLGFGGGGAPLHWKGREEKGLSFGELWQRPVRCVRVFWAVLA